MNQSLKSFLWLAVAAGSVLGGMYVKKQRDLEELNTTYAELTNRAANLVKDTAMAKAKLEVAQVESAAGSNFESQHLANQATIAAEQKSIEALLVQWSEAETGRAAAVQAVRALEPKRPPVKITLKDGTQMENFSVRSVVDESTVSAEYSSGLVKLTMDKLPEDIIHRLGLGWKVDKPTSMTIDKEGNAVVSAALKVAGDNADKEKTAKDLGLPKSDTTTMEAVTKSIAVAEARLAKATADFDTQRQKIRQLGMFKSSVVGTGGKSYGLLQKEANATLVALAGKVQALRAEVSNLKYKLKSF